MPVVPYLVYDDAPASIEFLCRAFGFDVAARVDMPDGGVGHAELVLGGSTLMLSGANPGARCVSPLALAGVHAHVWCVVDDVDAHYRRACDAGAVVIGPPSDQPFGFRAYQAIDPEGQRFSFASAIT